jgi:hypothetical protein
METNENAQERENPEVEDVDATCSSCEYLPSLDFHHCSRATRSWFLEKLSPLSEKKSISSVHATASSSDLGTVYAS